jgi:hypothetical protein
MKRKIKCSNKFGMLLKKDKISKKIISKFLEGQKPAVKQD